MNFERNEQYLWILDNYVKTEHHKKPNLKMYLISSSPGYYITFYEYRRDLIIGNGMCISVKWCVMNNVVSSICPAAIFTAGISCTLSSLLVGNKFLPEFWHH